MYSFYKRCTINSKSIQGKIFTFLFFPPKDIYCRPFKKYNLYTYIHKHVHVNTHRLTLQGNIIHNNLSCCFNLLVCIRDTSISLQTKQTGSVYVLISFSTYAYTKMYLINVAYTKMYLNSFTLMYI